MNRGRKRDYFVIMLRADGIIMSWNEDVKQFSGYEADETLGLVFSNVFLFKQSGTLRADQILNQVRAAGVYQEVGWQRRKDQTRFFASILITPLYGKGRVLSGYSMVVQDLTPAHATEKKKELERSVDHILFNTNTESEVLQQVGIAIRDFLGFPIGFFRSFDRTNFHLNLIEDFSVKEGVAPEFIQAMEGLIVSLGEGFSGGSAKARQLQWLSNARSILNFSEADVFKRFRITSGLSFPVYFEDSLVGCFEYYTDLTMDEDRGISSFLMNIQIKIAQRILYLRSSRAIERERLLLQSVIDGYPSPFFVRDLSGRIQIANAAAAKQIGVPIQEVIGRTLRTWVDPKIVDQSEDEDKEVIRRGTVLSNTRTYDENGNKKTYLVNRFPVQTTEGDTILVGTTTTDITNEKRQQVEIAEARDRLGLILELAGDGIHVLDNQGNVTLCSQSFAKMLGYTMEEAMRLNVADWDALIPKEELLPRIQALLKVGVIFETKHRTKSGRVIDVEINAKGIELGGRLFLYASSRDITDRKVTERLIRAAADAKASFLATMSHEIRTPLNAVIGMGELILKTNLSPRQREFAQVIQQSGVLLLGIVNDILDYSKIESGKLELHLESFSPVKLVETLVETLALRASEKSTSLTSFVSPDLSGEITADPGRLSQIILNLLGNAVKFTKEGGVRIRVVPSDRPQSEGKKWIRLEVIDSGIGISEEQRARLFQPFSQANDRITKTYGGTGLGLSISKKLIEAMQGEIGVISEFGKGATFWVEIPVLQAGTRKNTVRGGFKKLGHILIVDDDIVNRQTLEEYFSSWNLTSHSVATSEQALATLRRSGQKPVSVVIFSLGKDQKGGVERVKKIIEAFQGRPFQLILVGEFGRRVEISRIGKLSVKNTLYKPLKQTTLLEVLTGPDEEIKRKGRMGRISSKAARMTRKLSKIKILIADDVPANLMLLSALLENLGIPSLSVNDGNQVLRACEKERFDLILMDCQMPQLDGFETTQKIRRIETYNGEHIPIIAVTANAMSGEDQKCLSLGMDDYISKPISEDVLIDKLEKWLGIDLRRFRDAA